jgi:hypothetical protein
MHPWSFLSYCYRLFFLAEVEGQDAISRLSLVPIQLVPLQHHRHAPVRITTNATAESRSAAPRQAGPAPWPVESPPHHALSYATGCAGRATAIRSRWRRPRLLFVYLSMMNSSGEQADSDTYRLRQYSTCKSTRDQTGPAAPPSSQPLRNSTVNLPLYQPRPREPGVLLGIHGILLFHWPYRSSFDLQLWLSGLARSQTSLQQCLFPISR